jgi:hypothetical protein
LDDFDYRRVGDRPGYRCIPDDVYHRLHDSQTVAHPKIYASCNELLRFREIRADEPEILAPKKGFAFPHGSFPEALKPELEATECALAVEF